LGLCRTRRKTAANNSGGVTMQIPEIKNALKEALRDPSRRASYFIGGRGSGKSTLLAKTFKEVLEEERKRNDTKKLFFNSFR